MAKLKESTGCRCACGQCCCKSSMEKVMKLSEQSTVRANGGDHVERRPFAIACEWDRKQTQQFSDDGTNTFFWQAHTITVLVGMLAVLVYVALFELTPMDSQYNTKRGLFACVMVFLLFGVTQIRDGSFKRPHPAFWRLMLCLSVLYQLALIFILFQTLDDARQLLKYFDKSLGEPLPETLYCDDCSLYTPGHPDGSFHNFMEKCDFFVFCHLIGWWAKLEIRNAEEVKSKKIIYHDTFISIILKSMEDDMLTLEGMSDHMPRIGSYSGVRIREFDDGNINPEPVKRDDKETDDLWEEFLLPIKLKSLSGVSNLDDATCLEMLVNTDEQSLGNFGAMLPNLVQLKLSNSVISTVRDLGTSLGNLKILWMSQCGLTDLDGISSLLSLVELFVAFNDINDVSPVSMLDILEVLDLEGNLIDDLSQVEFLSLGSSLKSLNLEGNPVCVAPHANSSAEEMAGYEYRKSINQAVPRLKILDGEPFLVEKVGGKNVLRDMPESAKSARVPNHLKEEWRLISNALKTVENEQKETESSKPVAAARPASARKNTRPKTAMSRQRPSSAMRQRPGSSIGQRPGSSLGSSGNSFELSGIFQGNDSSDLTHGSGEVICGNISKALKARRKNIKAFNSVIPPFTTNSPIHTPEKSYEEENNKQFPSKHDVFTELREWRQQFAKFLEEDHKLPTSADTESSQSEGESPFSSPRKTEAANSISSASPTIPQPEMSPSPPPPKEHRHKRSSPLGRSLPTAPLVGRDLQRPHTSGEFRIRRYRQTSTEEKVELLLKNKLDLDVNENQSISTVVPRNPPSALAVVETEPRSSSAPVRALSRYRVLPDPPGTQRTSEDSPQPSSQTPVTQVSHGYRPGTAAAALQKRRLKPN